MVEGAFLFNKCYPNCILNDLSFLNAPIPEKAGVEDILSHSCNAGMPFPRCHSSLDSWVKALNRLGHRTRASAGLVFRDDATVVLAGKAWQTRDACGP